MLGEGDLADGKLPPGTEVGGPALVGVSRDGGRVIVASTAGPLLTGFVLMQTFTLQQMVLYLSVAMFVLGGLVRLLAVACVSLGSKGSLTGW